MTVASTRLFYFGHFLSFTTIFISQKKGTIFNFEFSKIYLY